MCASGANERMNERARASGANERMNERACASGANERMNERARASGANERITRHYLLPHIHRHHTGYDTSATPLS